MNVFPPLRTSPAIASVLWPYFIRCHARPGERGAGMGKVPLPTHDLCNRRRVDATRRRSRDSPTRHSNVGGGTRHARGPHRPLPTQRGRGSRYVALAVAARREWHE